MFRTDGAGAKDRSGPFEDSDFHFFHVSAGLLERPYCLGNGTRNACIDWGRVEIGWGQAYAAALWQPIQNR